MGPARHCRAPGDRLGPRLQVCRREIAWIVPIYIALIASFWLLIDALRQLPAGTAYAVWTGIGAVGVAALGMIFFREPATLVRIGCIALIVIGIVGLKVTHTS